MAIPKSRLIFLLFVLTTTLQYHSCINSEHRGPTIREMRDIGPFDAISVGDGINTYITQGDNIEILSGITVGDEIILEGARSVKNNQTVKVIKVEEN